MKRGMAAKLRRAAPGMLLGAAGLALSIAAQAAMPGSAFRVTVDLFTDVKVGVLCDRSGGKDGNGPLVVVTCIGEAPPALPAAPREPPRFLLHLSREGSSAGNVEGLMPPGTVTSWHVIKGAHRDYVEIVVGW